MKTSSSTTETFYDVLGIDENVRRMKSKKRTENYHLFIIQIRMVILLFLVK